MGKCSRKSTGRPWAPNGSVYERCPVLIRALRDAPRPSSNSLPDGSTHYVHGPKRIRVFPEPQYQPPATLKEAIRVTVTTNVCLNLSAPPIGVGLRPSSMLRAPVPEAAVDKNSNLLADEREVGATSCAWNEPVDTVSQTLSVHSRAQ